MPVPVLHTIKFTVKMWCRYLFRFRCGLQYFWNVCSVWLLDGLFLSTEKLEVALGSAMASSAVEAMAGRQWRRWQGRRWRGRRWRRRRWRGGGLVSLLSSPPHAPPSRLQLANSACASYSSTHLTYSEPPHEGLVRLLGPRRRTAAREGSPPLLQPLNASPQAGQRLALLARLAREMLKPVQTLVALLQVAHLDFELLLFCEDRRDMSPPDVLERPPQLRVEAAASTRGPLLGITWLGWGPLASKWPN